MAKTKKIEISKEYDGELATYEVLKPIDYCDENGDPSGQLEVGSVQKGFPVELGNTLVESGHMKLVEEKSPTETGEQELDIVPEPTEEVEMYNGKRIIGKGEVEINGITRKTITTEEGSTYTI